MTEFGKLNPDGSLSETRNIPQSKMMECPHFIMVPEHYREDNSCRCDDPDHTEMKEWGYRWNGHLWGGEDE